MDKGDTRKAQKRFILFDQPESGHFTFRSGYKPHEASNWKKDLRCIPARGGVVCRMGRKPIEGIPDHNLILSDPVNIPDSVECVGIVVREFSLRVLSIGYPSKEEQEKEAWEESRPCCLNTMSTLKRAHGKSSITVRSSNKSPFSPPLPPPFQLPRRRN
jgi:hypothetical protein